MKYVAITIISSFFGYVILMAIIHYFTFDNILIAALVAASFLNRQALIVLAGHCAAMAVYYAPIGDVYYNCTAGIIMALNAAVFIKLSYEIRQALLLTAALFWLAAVDAYLFPITETIYYTSFVYMVGAVNLYVLYLLMGGRRLVARLISAAQHWIFFCRNRILLQYGIQKQKAD